MTNAITVLYDHEHESVADCITIPPWIDQGLTCRELGSILEGGCASGAYMAAVESQAALETMSEYGDAVLEYIDSITDGVPAAPENSYWSELATFYLAKAIELWAGEAGDDVAEQLEKTDDPEAYNPDAEGEL